jgi:hypothetical protein
VSPTELIPLVVAVLAGATCGCALLLQILLRDIARDGSLGFKTKLSRIFLVARLAAAGLSVALLFMVLPRFTPHEGGSELQFWVVVASVLLVFALGFRPMQRLASRLLHHLAGR